MFSFYAKPCRLPLRPLVLRNKQLSLQAQETVLGSARLAEAEGQKFTTYGKCHQPWGNNGSGARGC